jgi:hypothetical protein
MQGGRTREIPLLTSDPVLAYSSGEPRGIRYAFEVRYASNSGDEADIARGPSRANSGLKLPLVETTSAAKSTLDFGLCTTSYDSRHWNSEAIVTSEQLADCLGNSVTYD